MVRIGSEFNMIKLSKIQIEDIITFIKKQNDVMAFFLFGSYGTEYQTFLSDVDFAVLPVSKKTFDVDKELLLLSELQRICRSNDINMINLLKVPLTLQMEILKNGRLLFCRHDVYLADFKEYVMRYYCDYEPDLRAFYEDYDARLREEYL